MVLTDKATKNADGFYNNIGTNAGYITINAETRIEGLQNLTFEFVDTEGRPFQIQANNGNIHVFMCNETTASFDAKDAKNCTIKVSLKKGTNLIKFFNYMSTDDNAEYSYARMAEQLQRQPNVPVFSLCEWGDTNSWIWGSKYGNAWRTTTDIRDTYESIIPIYEKNVNLDRFASINGWNDPDMMTVGMPRMTYELNIAHFSLWCIMTSPLMLGNDLRSITNDTLKIITNKYAIAVNQDANAIQGPRVYQ